MIREVTMVACGGACGAVARYGVASCAARWISPALPWGTLIVNVVGCFALGVLAEYHALRRLPSVGMFGVGVGFLGAFTTFSTFGHDTYRLWERGNTLYAIANVGGNLAFGLIAVTLGVLATRGIVSNEQLHQTTPAPAASRKASHVALSTAEFTVTSPNVKPQSLQESESTMSASQLHVHQAGDPNATSPTILWVHGFPLDHTMWQRQYEQLEDCHSLAVDLRGFGRSTGSDRFSLADLADDLRLVVEEQLAGRPFLYAGLSMGGYIAWEFLRQPPANLAGLILCDTRAAADSVEAQRARRVSAGRVLVEGASAIVPAMIGKLFDEATFTEQPEIVEATRQVMLGTDPTTISAALHAMADRPDSTDLLAGIELPTLLICGESDAITTTDEMRQMAGQIAGSTLKVIPRAGHMAPLEQPAAVNIEIRNFVQSLHRSP